VAERRTFARLGSQKANKIKVQIVPSVHQKIDQLATQ
jgi:hypothetical protein